MAQISRPFQVALAAVALLALIWVVALHRPGGSGASSSSGQASPASASSGKAASGSSSGGSSSASGAGVYHGSAPGVEGLSRAIAKAHGAVATSQQNATELAEKSAQASSNAAASASAPARTSTAPASTTHAKSVAPAVSASKTAAKAAPKPAPHRAATVDPLARQRLVEGELKQGKIVVLLFWSSRGSDDVAVRSSLRQLGGRDRHIAVHVATAGQVATFGSITRGVQVYGTPTILFVGKHGHTIVLTGLQDAYAIQQAVSDARHA